jgi:hypothetical protein
MAAAVSTRRAVAWAYVFGAYAVVVVVVDVLLAELADLLFFPAPEPPAIAADGAFSEEEGGAGMKRRP